MGSERCIRDGGLLGDGKQRERNQLDMLKSKVSGCDKTKITTHCELISMAKETWPKTLLKPSWERKRIHRPHEHQARPEMDPVRPAAPLSLIHI